MSNVGESQSQWRVSIRSALEHGLGEQVIVQVVVELSLRHPGAPAVGARAGRCQPSERRQGKGDREAGDQERSGEDAFD